MPSTTPASQWSRPQSRLKLQAEVSERTEILQIAEHYKLSRSSESGLSGNRCRPSIARVSASRGLLVTESRICCISECSSRTLMRAISDAGSDTWYRHHSPTLHATAAAPSRGRRTCFCCSARSWPSSLVRLVPRRRSTLVRSGTLRPQLR